MFMLRDKSFLYGGTIVVSKYLGIPAARDILFAERRLQLSPPRKSKESEMESRLGRIWNFLFNHLCLFKDVVRESWDRH
jgi:hypothetical protein